MGPQGLFIVVPMTCIDPTLANIHAQIHAIETSLLPGLCFSWVLHLTTSYKALEEQ